MYPLIKNCAWLSIKWKQKVIFLGDQPKRMNEYKLIVCNYSQQYHAIGLLGNACWTNSNHISLAAPLLSINLCSEFLVISTLSFSHFQHMALVFYEYLIFLNDP